MSELQILAELIGKKMHKLSIFRNGQYIGEYERSQKNDIERKSSEIELAESILLGVFIQHGEFVVRWDGKNKKKSIRINGIEVGEIPKECWQKPSWE